MSDVSGEWLGGPDQEGGCPAVAGTGIALLCTLEEHPPGSYHEAWGMTGQHPIAYWRDGEDPRFPVPLEPLE